MSTSEVEAWVSSFLLKENMPTYRICMLATFPQCDVQEEETI